MTSVERNEMEERIHVYVESIKAEDRIGQLINYYKETVSEFQPNSTEESINWQKLLLLDKMQANLLKIFLPGLMIRAIRKIKNNEDNEL